jgi:glucose-6-phosphate 1-epimerase
MDIQQLNTKFGIYGHISFESGNGNLTVAKISNAHATAVVSLYGAHVQSYIPNDQKEVLWMSPKSAFEQGKAIRGGIPVCFPWFGPHGTDTQKPMHGFARLSIWEVLKTSELVNGDTLLVLGLQANAYTKSLFPFEFTAQVEIVVGKKLDVTLIYKNTGNEPLVCSDALHSYLNISNVANIGISGLKSHSYYAGFAKTPDHKQEEEILPIAQEENRRYINHTADCVIADKGYNRKIRVAKRGSKVTVVWNPWEATAKTMADIPDDGYLSFVCVEAANYYDNSITLAPSEGYSIATTISVE